MIYALRRRHRSLVFLAAIAGPLILWFALSGRAPVITDSTPLIARNIPALGTVLLGEHTLQLLPVGKSPLVHAALLRESDSDAPWTMALTDTGQYSPGPDVLVYWQQNSASGQLAGDAVLLGPYLAQRENRFTLPVRRATGSIVFYSLAHNTVLGESSLQQIMDGA